MMDVNIPEEALEAAAKAIVDTRYYDGAWDRVLAEVQRDAIRLEARAACLAMINSWPGMKHFEALNVFGIPPDMNRPAHIILPLPEKGEG